MSRVLVLGGASWDTVIDLERFPDPRPHTLFSRGGREVVGSTGAGKALNLAALGIDVTFHAMLGDDAAGAQARAALARPGLRVLADVDPAGTERHVNLLDADGRRISIFWAYGSPEPDYDEGRLVALLPGVDAVALNIVNASRRLIPALRRAGRPVWVDVHDWDGANGYHRDFVDAADVLFLSSDALSDPRGLVSRLVSEGKQAVVCTHGRHGATALTVEDGWLEVPIAPGFTRVDTNGAGDAFFSGVLWARLRGLSWAAALRVGTIVAGLCVASRELVHSGLSPERVAAEHRRAFGADPG